MRNVIFDDSDMKIVDDRPGRKIGSSADDAPVEEQLANGNIACARTAGACIAGLIETEATRLDSGAFAIPNCDDKDVLSRKLLMIFALVVAIEQKIEDKFLMRTALNSFYDTLKKENPEIYDAMSSSGAFTFYYLAYRRANDTRSVGSTFSMLCGNDGEEPYINVGCAVFEHYFKLGSDTIAAVKFA